MKLQILETKFRPSLDAFQKALHELGFHLAMPPEWARFWTKGVKKGSVELRIADSIIFNNPRTKFYDATFLFEKRGKIVDVGIVLKQPIGRGIHAPSVKKPPRIYPMAR